MLLSLAIADDIGAILVIAIGYTTGLNITALILAFIGIGIMFLMMKVGVRNIAVYVTFMILVWFSFHESGIHATIAGVIFGLMVPARSYISEGRLGSIVQSTGHILSGRGWKIPSDRYHALREMEIATRKSVSPLERFETKLHPWVAFLIMPVFAFANAGVTVEISDFTNPVAIAVIVGLFVGKPLGIVLFSWLAVRTGLARLPTGVGWGAIIGGGFLAGIGFTMALFIAGLALDGNVLDASKVGIIIGSVMSAIVGVSLLIYSLPKPEEDH
jgi:NhaA family Na+:H+ antiporter